MDNTNNHTEHRRERLIVAGILVLVLLGTIFCSYQISKGETAVVVEEADDSDFSVSGAIPIANLSTVIFTPLGTKTPNTAHTPFTLVSSSSQPPIPFGIFNTVSSASIAPHPAPVPGPFASSLSSLSSSSIFNIVSSSGIHPAPVPSPFASSLSSLSSTPIFTIISSSGIHPAPFFVSSVSSLSSTISSSYASCSSSGYPFFIVPSSSSSSYSSSQIVSSSSHSMRVRNR